MSWGKAYVLSYNEGVLGFEDEDAVGLSVVRLLFARLSSFSSTRREIIPVSGFFSYSAVSVRFFFVADKSPCNIYGTVAAATASATAA
jgi:hypothetical protein